MAELRVVARGLVPSSNRKVIASPLMDGHTDAELLERWSAGDQAALCTLVGRHFEAVDRFFRNKVSDGHDDLVQQTFAACVEARGEFRGNSSFRTYLFGIAHNKLFRHYRARAREAGRLEWREMTAMDLGPGPSSVLRQRRERALVLEALRAIPITYQVVLELRYWEELEASAIAEVIGTTEDTVRNRLRRGKALLEIQLEERARSKGEFERTLGDFRTWVDSLQQGSGDQKAG